MEEVAKWVESREARARGTVPFAALVGARQACHRANVITQNLGEAHECKATHVGLILADVIADGIVKAIDAIVVGGDRRRAAQEAQGAQARVDARDVRPRQARASGRGRDASSR